MERLVTARVFGGICREFDRYHSDGMDLMPKWLHLLKIQTVIQIITQHEPVP